MKAYRLKLMFVTPAFLAGSNQEQAEWRAPSIRGQLRWWLRAVVPGDLDHVRAVESRIFGSTSRQSAITVRVGRTPLGLNARQELEGGARLSSHQLAEAWGDDSDATLRRLALPSNVNPITYLGYGCLDHHGKLTRGCIRANAPAELALLLRGPLAAEDLGSLHRALWCWLNLGGIGAKSRNGFGSLQVSSSGGDLWDTELPRLSPGNVEDLGAGFRSIMKEVAEGGPGAGVLPEWTRLAEGCRLSISGPARSWDAALQSAGAWLIAFRRRYGSPGHAGTLPSGAPLSNRDYDWAAPGGRHRKNDIPDKAGFGLPLPFGRGGETVVWGSHQADHRRASPLLLHVAKLGARFHSVWTHLPARLIPRGERLYFKGSGARGWSVTAEQEDICSRFLDDLEGKQLVERVWP